MMYRKQLGQVILSLSICTAIKESVFARLGAAGMMTCPAIKKLAFVRLG
jgi:hypothetical protein